MGNLLLVFSLIAVLSVPAFAQASLGEGYPTKPVMIIVANVSGGATDVETRMYAQKLSEALGKPFVVEYKPGAGGSIGAAFVAKATPDGYTLLVASTSFPVVPAFKEDLPYDVVKDFAPLSLMSKRPTVLIVHPSYPAKNLKEYVAYTKTNPGKTSFGTSGNGGVQHLAGAWLHSTIGTEVTFVHYKGANAVIPDLIAGRVHAFPANFITAMPLIRSGKVRALATLSLERSSLLPELPTASEEGVSGFELPSWVGLVTTGGVPSVVVSRLSGELTKIAKAPDILKKMGEDTVMVGSSPTQFGDLIRTEVTRWRHLVKTLGITQD